MRRSATLAAALVLAGCGILPPARAELTELPRGVPFEPPDGPVVILGRGQLPEMTWEVVAYRVRNGNVCTFQIFEDRGAGGGCGPIPEDDAAFGPLGANAMGDDQFIVDAVLSADVRRVRIETDGEPIETEVLSLTATGLDVTGFAAVLPPGVQPTELVALDAGGSELERFELLSVQPVPSGPGVAPTPAGP